MAGAQPSAQKKPQKKETPLHKIVLALALGTLGGWLAYTLNVPLPWMLGAMISTTAAAICRLPVALPMLFRTAMIGVLGVMLGSGFAPEILDSIADWRLSLIGLAVYTLAITGLVTLFLRKICGYDPVTAYFSAAPGGLSELVLVGSQFGGDERIISLTHTSRILLVVLALPFLMQLIFGYTPGARPPAGSPLVDSNVFDLLVLTFCGVAGFFAARLARLPAAAVLGPMLFSAALHMTGVTDARPPVELIAAAQVVVGTTIGCRFAGVKMALVARSIVASIGSTIILVVSGLLFAMALHPLTGLPTIGLFLAFAPGGVAEMSLIALALSIDTALVATHHIVRIFFIVVFTPLLFRVLPAQIVGRRQLPAPGED